MPPVGKRPLSSQPTPRDASCATSADPIEIPGFFYDPEKKKYFKWSPEIRARANALKAAQQRVKELAGDEKPAASKCLRRNMTVLVRDRAVGLGATSQLAFRHAAFSSIAAALRCPPGDGGRLMLDPSSDRVDRILPVRSLRDDGVLRLPAVVVIAQKQSTGRRTVQVSDRIRTCRGNFSHFHHATTLRGPLSHGSVMYLREMPSGFTDGRAVLRLALAYTVTPLSEPSILHVQPIAVPCLDSGPRSSGSPRSWSLGSDAPTCCDSDDRTLLVAVGVGHKITIADLNDSSAQVNVLCRHTASVQAVRFCPRNEQVLYVGTQDGQLHCHDRRQPGPAQSFSVAKERLLNEHSQHRQEQQRSAATLPELSGKQPKLGCLQPLRKLPQIVVSYSDGQIATWDIRSRKMVCHYLGNVNDYRLIPPHVDENEHFVCSGGRDGIVRIWNLMESGPPLVKLCSPEAEDGVPQLVFTTSHGPPMVMLALREHVLQLTYLGSPELLEP